jgi:hypothetical protein
VAKEMREFAAYVENMGKLGKKLLTPAGSRINSLSYCLLMTWAFFIIGSADIITDALCTS